MIHNITTLETKDWARMKSLILKKKSGSAVAKSIKELRKAIARFTAGNVLCGVSVDTVFKFFQKNKSFTNAKGCGIFFEDFGNRALELGAKIEDIVAAFTKNKIPKSFDITGCPIASPDALKDFKMQNLSLKGYIKEISFDDFEKGIFKI